MPQNLILIIIIQTNQKNHLKKNIVKKIIILTLLIANIYLILGCDFNQNKEIIAEQRIGELSRIVLINTSSEPSFCLLLT